MVPAFDHRPVYLELKSELDEAIARVLASGRLILGPEVEAFERELAVSVGVAGAVGVGSGTEALTLALKALQIGPGDEVVTTSNSGVPPVAAIRAAGALPKFVDVRPETLLMDTDALEAACTARTRAILPVHLYGQPVAMDAVMEIAGRRRLAVVEDCAQAQGATWRGRPVGSFGAVGCFSFYPTKNLGAFGDGGACVTRRADLERRLRMLRMYGFDGERHARLEGVNSRLDELQAAILRVKLRHLSRTIERRRAAAARYRATHPVFEQAGGTHTYHLLVIRVQQRARVMERLAAAGITPGIHYPVPVHLMEAYRGLGGRPGDLPVTEAACASVLSLPLFEGITEAQIDRVIGALGAA